MVLIRKVEESLLDLFSKGKLFGTTHTYIGQEANAVGIISNMNKDDIIFSNHRCHGHYLTFTDDVKGLIAELMGKNTGVCGGKGGSQHICKGNFYSNGVQGGIVPNAVGMAYAEKKLGRKSITAVFLGDGTLGQGVVYEAMNIASLWSLPIIFVIENNYYAQSTPSYLQLAGKISDRPKAFGIETYEVSSNEVEAIYRDAREIINNLRGTQKPVCLILNTYRFSPHSKGDDFRDRLEIEEWKKKDPIVLAKERLDSDEVKNIDSYCIQRVEEAIKQAVLVQYPESSDIDL